jgi:hypothetical protein
LADATLQLGLLKLVFFFHVECVAKIPVPPQILPIVSTKDIKDRVGLTAKVDRNTASSSGRHKRIIIWQNASRTLWVIDIQAVSSVHHQFESLHAERSP